MLRECSALVASYDEQLEQLRGSIAAMEADRACACADRDKARSLLDSLNSAVAEARELRASRAQSQNPRLRVVAGPTPSAPESAAPKPPGPDGGVVISGERSVLIMRVVASDTERQWSARAVTESLGEPVGAVRRVRSVLESLCDRGVLARREQESVTGRKHKKVFYGLAAPWQAA